MKMTLLITLCVLCASVVNVPAQDTPPPPSTPRSAVIPKIHEKRLANGLTVAVVERKGVPLVSVELMVDTGITYERIATAGLTRMSMNLLTRGTKTRTASQISNEIEFIGGEINTGVGLDWANLSIEVTSDKISKGLTLMSDVALNPTFPVKELDLIKKQSIDELTFNLKQPSFLSNYVATAFSFNGFPASGTLSSIGSIKRAQILEFYHHAFQPDRATLVFVGDIDAETAFAQANAMFGKWANRRAKSIGPITTITESIASGNERARSDREQPLLKRILVIDLPKSGQASVSFAKAIDRAGRIVWDENRNQGITGKYYFPGIVLNSVLGGGYSSRLNMEIRIKRGLSYGAGSSFTWRAYDARFSTNAQTKNESVPEVARLTLDAIRDLSENKIAESELEPRKAVLIGSFGRMLETNGGLMGAVLDLYSNSLPASSLNAYLGNVQAVDAVKVMDFASQKLNGGDIIIVGDYSIFKDDLAKRFPGITVQVVKAADLDLTKRNLHK